MTRPPKSRERIRHFPGCDERNEQVLKMSAEAIEGYKDEIRNLSEMLRDTKADAAVARHALETQLEEMQAKLETTRIDLVSRTMRRNKRSLVEAITYVMWPSSR